MFLSVITKSLLWTQNGTSYPVSTTFISENDRNSEDPFNIPGSVAAVRVPHVAVDEGVGGRGGGGGGAHRVKVAGGGTAPGVQVGVVHFALQYMI